LHYDKRLGLCQIFRVKYGQSTFASQIKLGELYYEIERIKEILWPCLVPGFSGMELSKTLLPEKQVNSVGYGSKKALRTIAVVSILKKTQIC